MPRLISFLVLIISLFAILSEAKKKAKDKRPPNIEPELFCNSCQAIVRESLKKLKYKTSESDVFEVLEKICEMNNFFVYDYPPPEMNKGCQAFYEVWQETLEKEITKRKNDEEIEDKICLKITKACEGVNLEAKRDENRKKSTDKVKGGIRIEPDLNMKKGEHKIEF